MTSRTLRESTSLRMIAYLCMILSLLIGQPQEALAESRLADPEEWPFIMIADDHYSFRYPASASVRRPFAQNTTIDLAEGATITILAIPNPENRSVEAWIDMLQTLVWRSLGLLIPDHLKPQPGKASWSTLT